MRRHPDKFRQKCQIENSRHIVIKRERIGLNWFKIFQSFSMKSKVGWSMLGSGIAQARKLVEKTAEITIFMLLIWPTAFILCAVQPGAISLIISTES